MGLRRWARHWYLRLRYLLTRGETLRLTESYRVTMRDGVTGEVVSDHLYKNVICVPGKNYVASWINQEIGTNPTIYGAVGTSTTAPLSSDTKLGAEVSTGNAGRVALATQSRTGNQVVFDFFWTTSQGNVGQLNEAGVFLGGSITTDSGNLLSHDAISENKDSTKTLTIEWTINVGS